MKIPLSVFSAAKCCDSESTSYVLGGVRIEQDANGTPYAIATNGRHMAILTWDDTDDPKPLIGPVVIPGGMCQSLAKVKDRFPLCFPLSRNMPGAEAVTLSMNGDGKVKLCIGSDPVVAVEMTPLEGRYPQWRDAVPKDRKGERTACVDHRFLARLISVIAAHCCNSEQRGVYITIPADDSAVVVSGENQGNRAIGVIMPIVTDSPIAPPNWLASNAAEVQTKSQPEAKPAKSKARKAEATA